MLESATVVEFVLDKLSAKQSALESIGLDVTDVAVDAKRLLLRCCL